MKLDWQIDEAAIEAGTKCVESLVELGVPLNETNSSGR